MERVRGRGNAGLVAAAIIFLQLARCSMAYMIYKVGEDEGWTNRLKGSTVDYEKWATDKTFSVGDMLVFAYESNHTVVQTNSHDAYESCNANVEDAQIWSSEGSTESNVLLKTEGKTYFFCSAWDGAHCRAGMRFGINVARGNGSALSPVESPPFAPSPSGSDDAVPPSTSTAGGASAGTASSSETAPSKSEATSICCLKSLLPVFTGFLLM